MEVARSSLCRTVLLHARCHIVRPGTAWPLDEHAHRRHHRTGDYGRLDARASLPRATGTNLGPSQPQNLMLVHAVYMDRRMKHVGLRQILECRQTWDERASVAQRVHVPWRSCPTDRNCLNVMNPDSHTNGAERDPAT
jgi:hypothetical protein